MGELLSVIGEMLPRPEVRVEVVLPYTRGDLVSEAHASGEILKESHGGDGYEIIALVDASLARRMLDAAALASGVGGIGAAGEGGAGEGGASGA